MKAVVLAAGKGTRLLPLTKEIPKPMVPIVGKPMIQHIFELLAASGVDETRVNAFHLAESVLACYGERSWVEGMSVNVSREERLMGTAGGVKRLASISRSFDEAFVVVMGDALTDIDVREVVAFHKEQKALATLALMPVSDTSQYGVVRLDGEGNILAFQEKPSPKEAISTLANTGIYVLEPRVLDYVPEDTFFDFANDLFPRLLETGERFVGYRGEEDFYWSDVGTLEAYRAAHADALAGKVRVKISGERLGEGLWIDRDAQIHQTTLLEGPVVLGRDAVVERGVTLSRNVTVGASCRVLSGATVKGSVLLPGSRVGIGAYLEGCIVGPGYDVPPRKRIRGEALSCSAN
jgi:NDP-sugar pyrophosphorylase family protein